MFYNERFHDIIFSKKTVLSHGGYVLKKRIISLICLFLIISLLPGCSSDNKEETDVTIVNDQLGRQITLKDKVKRVVSTSYITTSTCLALNINAQLVGIEKNASSHSLYQKADPDILELPQVGTDVSLIAKTAPDIVFITKENKNLISDFEERHIKVAVVDPSTEKKYQAMVTLIAKICGKQDYSKKLNNYYSAQMQKLNKYNNSNKKIYIASKESIYRTVTTSMFENTIIKSINAKNAASRIKGVDYPTIALETLLTLNPDIMIIPAHAAYSKDSIYNYVFFSSLDVVKNKKIYIMPEIIESWEDPIPSHILASLWLTYILHPNDYTFDHYKKDVIDFYKEFYGFEIDGTLITK